MKKTIVYDALMGSGKTHNAIERMRKYLKNDKRFIYVTPFLSEVNRVCSALGKDKVVYPKGRDEFDLKNHEINDNLINSKGKFNLNAKSTFNYLNKRKQFLKFASNRESIICTHSLFMSLKREDYNLFQDYILILDEVVNPLKVVWIGEKDIKILQNEELIMLDKETDEVRFIDDDYDDDAFRKVKMLCRNSSVYYLDRCFFVWVFPKEIFLEFKRIEILTYLFEGSFLAAYFKMFGIDYIVKKNESKSELEEIKKLLLIYEGNVNYQIGSSSFSKSWLQNLQHRHFKKISTSVSNLFKRQFNTKSNENAFTTFKVFKSKLSGRGYTKGFIPINSRASNDYREKKSLAYLGNRYFTPQESSFFRKNDIKVDEDLWALSELIQWIWRGCIRDKKEMNLFIPSKRMRTLLYNWLDGKYLVEDKILESVK